MICWLWHHLWLVINIWIRVVNRVMWIGYFKCQWLVHKSGGHDISFGSICCRAPLHLIGNSRNGSLVIIMEFKKCSKSDWESFRTSYVLFLLQLLLLSFSLSVFVFIYGVAVQNTRHTMHLCCSFSQSYLYTALNKGWLNKSS